jgi:hypothetical protein
MLYPFPNLMQSALIGANGSDPTIPYSPGWPQRLGSSLWSIVRRNQPQSPQATCSTTSCAATT